MAENKVEYQEVLPTKVSCIKIGNLGNIVAVGMGNGLVMFYNIDEGKFVSKNLKYHRNFITSLTFNEDDTRCFSSAYESNLFVWNLETFRKSDKIETCHKEAVTDFVLTENGYLTGGKDGLLQKCEYGQ